MATHATDVEHVGPSPSPPVHSRNYFAKHWSLRGGARRMKNVVMFVDWVPNPNGNATREPTPSADDLTAEQERCVRETFDLMDADTDAALTDEELKLVLHFAGAEQQEEVGDGGAAVLSPAAPVRYDAFRSLFARRGALNPTHAGRYQVVLSLAEAEAVRAAMHVALLNGTSLLSATGGGEAATEGGGGGGGGPSLSLHMLHPSSHQQGVAPLDVHRGRSGAASSTSPPPALPSGELRMSEQALRFFDSQVAYDEGEQDLLLRALGRTSLADRVAFFEGVRACRRRLRYTSCSVHASPALSRGVTELAGVCPHAKPGRLTRGAPPAAPARQLLFLARCSSRT